MVFCAHYHKELPALETPPMSGPLGDLLYKHISFDAWQEWLEVQIKIINEERLDLSEETAQQRLFAEMISFLGLKEFC